jgi:hypothetical protein
MASGPGSSMQKFSACRNRGSSSQPFLDQLPVHQRNLSGWPAEGKKPDAAEDAKQFRP